MPVIKKGLFILAFIFTFYSSDGQQIPLYPISYRMFSPFIFNPAIAGSKDYFSVDFLASKYVNSNSEVVSGNTRLSKSNPGYFSSPGATEFTNIGVGGLFFNDLNGLSRNLGFGGTGSYHLQLDKNALSFLSFGITVKAVYNQYSGDTLLSKPAKNTFFPGVDIGVYYYSKSLFAGLSATNLFGNPEKPDSLGFNSIQVSRQLFLQIGGKVVLSKSLNILMEPSVIVNYSDSLPRNITDMIQPALKVYAGNFCLGTYFYNYNKISFFFQYKYPKFYIGTYFELPKDSPFYKNPLRVEFALGLNISAIKSGSARLNHW